MEEEGTVVYFKTSPAVQGLEGSDSLQEQVFTDRLDSPVEREKWKNTPAVQGLEGSDSLQEQVFTDRLDSPAEREKWKNVRDTSRARKGFPWKQAFSPPNWFGRRSQELRQAQQVVEKIKESPLLTEEDYQLLHFTTAVQKWRNVSLSSANFSTLRLSTSRLARVRYQLVSCLVTVLLAWGVTVSGGRWIAVAALVVLVICGCVAMATKHMYRQSVKKMQKAVSDLSVYNSKFESLLALLTQTIRLVQETEIVSHGYSRPSGVPIARVERQGGGVEYQCMALRRRVFETCQQGVVLLRRATVSLCKNYPLSEELDNTHSYLAFVPLEDLHPHFQEPTSCTEAKPTAEHVSLESLKDAGSLLAVQNSEMLKRLALNLAPVHVNSSKVRKFHLVAMSQMLQELIYFVSEASEKLTWSFEFHKNYLFGDPPVRSTVLEKQEKTHPLLQAIAEEVHCVDLKTQAALQKTRELGLLLEKLQMSEDSATGSMQGADVQTIRAEMLSIQQGLESVTEHLTEGTQLIDKLQQPKMDSQNPVVSSGVANVVGVDDAGPEDQQQHSVEESSDEEMVFEAYVSADHSERENPQGLSEDKSEHQWQKAKDAPIKMVKELRSVLAIRSLEKQRRREEKQKRKILKELSIPGEDHAPSEVNSSLKGYPLPKGECADKPCLQFNMEGKDQFEKHAEDNTDFKPVVHPGTMQEEKEPSDTTADETCSDVAVPTLAGERTCSEAMEQTCSQDSGHDHHRRTDIVLGSDGSSSRSDHSRFGQQLLDNRVMAEAAAAVAMLSGQGSEEVFQDSSEDDCPSDQT